MSINQLSDQFYSFIWSNYVLRETTPTSNGIILFGWNDGGCRSLMKAVMLWLGDEAIPYQIVTDESIRHSNHALCKVGNYFIDGQGIHSKSEKIKIWKEEGIDPIILRPFDVKNEPNNGDEEPFYYEDFLINKMAELLDIHFDKNEFLRQLQEGDVVDGN